MVKAALAQNDFPGQTNLTRLSRPRPLAAPRQTLGLQNKEPSQAILDDTFRPSSGSSPSITSQVIQVPLSPLASGLSPSVDALLKQWGCESTRADFENIVADALPGHSPQLTLSSLDFGHQKRLRVQCQWLDERGEEAANWAAQLSKEGDGSLKFYWGGTWTRPEERGQGMLEKLALGNLELLRKVSGHPQDRLEIDAGAGGESGQFNSSEVVGRYLWARLGIFEFSPDGSRERLQEAFCGWLDEAATKNPQLTPTLVEQLKLSSRSWTGPEQFAEVDSPFVKLEVTRQDGRARQCSLGKAFLLDPKTPSWSGQCRPNKLEESTMQRAFQLLAWTSKGALSGQPAPSRDQLASRLQTQLQESAPGHRRRIELWEKLAQLTGSIDIPGFSADTGLRPDLIEKVLGSEVARQDSEPRAILQSALSKAVLRQEDEYRRRFQDARGQPISELEFRKFIARHDGNYRSMDTELLQSTPRQ